MKSLATLVLCLALISTPAVLAQRGSPKKITNGDVVKMVQAGLSPELIIAKIKKSEKEFDTSGAALAELKKIGVPNEILLLMLDSDPSPPDNTAKKSKRVTDELTTAFQRLQTSVVTVWSEYGRGTGFIIDRAGLVLTNQHVIGPSEYVAVQFDNKRKVRARLLASDPEKDVAVLWINLEAIPDATVAPIANSTGDEPPVVEGERVLTIGSPLHQRKIMTTGIASKVEARAIISDININHGNSGGPLFNSLGEVVGITTFGDFSTKGGPGVSGIVRIEETFSLIEQARRKMKGATGPEARLLPVEPTEPFPLAAIKAIATSDDFKMPRYFFNVGEFNVLLMTPAVSYRLATETEREALKTKNKRTDKDGAVRGTFRPFDELRNWGEYVGEYQPVLFIRASPQAGESFWGLLGRSFAMTQGLYIPATVRFKTDFYKMRLMCGGQEVEPINPSKVAMLLNESNRFVTAQDATYQGIYAYPANAISSQCGKVKLEIYSERNPEKARVKVLDDKTVARVDDDFAPYYQKYGRPTLSLGEPSSVTETPRTKQRDGDWWKMSDQKP